MPKPSRKIVKATFQIPAELVARVNAKAFLAGQSRDAMVTTALEECCRGLVLYAREKTAARGPIEVSASCADDVQISDGVSSAIA